MATLQWRGAVGEIYSILTALILHRNLDELLKSRLFSSPFPSRRSIVRGYVGISCLSYLAVRQTAAFLIK